MIHRRALTASAVEKTRSEPGMMKLNGFVTLRAFSCGERSWQGNRHQAVAHGAAQVRNEPTRSSLKCGPAPQMTLMSECVECGGMGG